MKPGLPAFAPRRTSGPRAILGPGDVARKMPAIDDEMGARDNCERIGILCQEKETAGRTSGNVRGPATSVSFFPLPSIRFAVRNRRRRGRLVGQL